MKYIVSDLGLRTKFEV